MNELVEVEHQDLEVKHQHGAMVQLKSLDDFDKEISRERKRFEIMGSVQKIHDYKKRLLESQKAVFETTALLKKQEENLARLEKELSEI